MKLSISFPAMRYFVEEKGMSIKSSSREVEKVTDGQVTASRAEQVWIRRKGKTATNVAEPKPNYETYTVADLERIAGCGGNKSIGGGWVRTAPIQNETIKGGI